MAGKLELAVSRKPQLPPTWASPQECLSVFTTPQLFPKVSNIREYQIHKNKAEATKPLYTS